MSDAGLFELESVRFIRSTAQLSWPGSSEAARERDVQDEGAHGGLPAPRCTHEKDLKE